MPTHAPFTTTMRPQEADELRRLLGVGLAVSPTSGWTICAPRPLQGQGTDYSVPLAMEIMYRVGLRPEEVIPLKAEDFVYPATEGRFGEPTFASADPGTRKVPVYPKLAAKLVEHI